MELPAFRYHPDPVATGSVETSTQVCVCCKQARGYIYTGAFYSPMSLEDDGICPWCISDGSAHRAFQAAFTETDLLGDWSEVPETVKKTVETRTPGFTGWQSCQWWAHCGDAATYLGMAGGKEVLAHGPNCVERLRVDLGWDPGEEFDEYIRDLHVDGHATAYLFKCRHCGEVGGYSDFS